MRISDWSSDVCSSDLPAIRAVGRRQPVIIRVVDPIAGAEQQRIHPEADREAAIAVLPAVRRIIARLAIGRAVVGAIIAPVVAAHVALAASELGPLVATILAAPLFFPARAVDDPPVGAVVPVAAHPTVPSAIAVSSVLACAH